MTIESNSHECSALFLLFFLSLQETEGETMHPLSDTQKPAKEDSRLCEPKLSKRRDVNQESLLLKEKKKTCSVGPQGAQNQIEEGNVCLKMQ